MAQGAVKVKKPAAAPKKPAGPKRLGAKVIKPKKASLISQNQIKKKNAAGLVGMTEKFLAEKAGHLEILRGGKKDRLEKEKKERKGKF